MNYTGKTALITGASSGIGEAFARALAKQGANLVLVARSETKLKALSTELHRQYGINADTIAVDLSRENIGLQVYEETQKRQLSVDLLINNAGFSTNGQFETISTQDDHQQIMVNIASVVDLTHTFIPAMLTRGEGTIINVGSTASFYPLPYQAVYGATKAFILSFTEALWTEYRGRGIRVLALCPGPTDTAFFDTMGRDVTLKKHSTQEVVQLGLSALQRNQHYAIPGFANTFTSDILPRLLPRSVLAKLVGTLSQRVFTAGDRS